MIFAFAFAGGLLALLAPCSALLLPAFFAYAFTSLTHLVRATLLFLLGLCCVLLPMGLAASLAGRLVIEYRQTTIIVAGAMLIGLGVLLLLGCGFALPWSAPARTTTPFASGIVYGLTGFCSGPLLGGVLTVAAAGQNPPLGALLLLVYGVGMVAPLFVLAAFWDRLNLGRMRASTRWTSLVGGVLLVVIGAAFIVSQGGLLLSGAYDVLGLNELGLRLQDWLASTLDLG